MTHADLYYAGSITIDLDLLGAAGIVLGEKVTVVDVTGGARLETDTIAGEPGSGVVCINGMATHLVHVGEVVIVSAYGLLTT